MYDLNLSTSGLEWDKKDHCVCGPDHSHTYVIKQRAQNSLASAIALLNPRSGAAVGKADSDVAGRLFHSVSGKINGEITE